MKAVSGDLGPGPAYNPDKAKSNNNAFSMGAKLVDIQEKKRGFVPGPGAHSPYLPPRMPNGKFGSDKRHSMASESIAPGPGNYTNDGSSVLTKAPRFGFGTSKREDEASKKMSVPGPGNYSTKSFTGKD